MTINKATLSGFDFPLDAPVAESIDGVSYKVYRSSNSNLGTSSIDIFSILNIFNIFNSEI